MWKLVVVVCLPFAAFSEDRPRLRELGVQPGTLPAGTLNSITDVAGVRVGHTTLRVGDTVRTGVTAILPHEGNLFREKVPGAVFVGNGFGKLAGSTQVNELGEIETPILLTSTLNVPRVADALIDYMLALPGNEYVRSINPLVAETNDGLLNDIRSRPVGRDHVFAALRAAHGGPVEEGAVGAGTGTVCFNWKGGIGTASRVAGGYTVGVLVQTNFGGSLRILGAPIGESTPGSGDGSVIVVIATDAPLDHRSLMRMGARAMLGLGRTGSSGSNGSGDYAIAFSTHRDGARVSNDEMSPLFLAVIEATEEAVYNSLLKAETTSGNGRTIRALPVKTVVDSLRRHGVPAHLPGTPQASWGTPAGGLRLGLSTRSGPVPSLLVSLRNDGTLPLTLLLGGETGSGRLYSFKFHARNPKGDSCELLTNLRAGAVGGYIGPVIVLVEPGKVHEILVPYNDAICVRNRQDIEAGELLRQGYAIEAAFFTDAKFAAWGRVPSAWQGEVRSSFMAQP